MLAGQPEDQGPRDPCSPCPHHSPSWSVRLDRKKALGAGSQTKGSVGQSDTSSAAQSTSPPLDSDLSFQDPKECLECNGARQPLGSRGQSRGCLCASKPDLSLERSLPDLQSLLLPHSLGHPFPQDPQCLLLAPHFITASGKRTHPTGHMVPWHSLE